MIINSESVQLIRLNATRLAQAVHSKEELIDLSTAGSFEQVFSAIEGLLTNTEMFFDDELLSMLDEENWKSFKATLLVYTLNLVNRFQVLRGADGQVLRGADGQVLRGADGQVLRGADGHHENHSDREYSGASSHP